MVSTVKSHVSPTGDRMFEQSRILLKVKNYIKFASLKNTGSPRNLSFIKRHPNRYVSFLYLADTLFQWFFVVFVFVFLCFCFCLFLFFCFVFVFFFSCSFFFYYCFCFLFFVFCFCFVSVFMTNCFSWENVRLFIHFWSTDN